MKRHYRIIGLLFVIALLAVSCGQAIQTAGAATPAETRIELPPATPVPYAIDAVCDTNSDGITTSEELIYHDIVVNEQGTILPWYDPSDLCASYDHVIRLVFNWWLTMPGNPGEPDIPYYLMHMTWQPPIRFNGLGGDQLAMAMSSWRLLYAYTGDPRTIADMVLMADHVINNGLSPASHPWPNIPYPYNFDENQLDKLIGDYMYGENIAQTDKAGSLGYEFVYLYKITGEERFLQAAVNIANTLAQYTQVGTETMSPLPFRVKTSTGEFNDGLGNMYTTNFTATLMLWEDLTDLGQGNLANYAVAHDRILNWLRTYPVHNNAWGPFFEDGPGYSVTQINAVTLAMYIMEHRDLWGPTWQEDARFALDWPIDVLINNNWIDYGVYVINEQTGYMQPGNSHTSRQASMELRYAELTGDTSRVENAVRQLTWATYMVDFDGKNRYPNDGIWLTDGYGDYVRHYLRAMAAAPGLAPDDQDHLLRTSSVITSIAYQAGRIDYQTYDARADEKLKITTFTPLVVTAGGVVLPKLNSIAALETQQGYTYGAPGDLPTVMRIRHDNATTIVITGDPSITPTPPTPSSTPPTPSVTPPTPSPTAPPGNHFIFIPSIFH